MTFRLEIDTAFNCRPNKGERRAKDGSGRLVKCQISYGDTVEGLLSEAKAARAASDKIAPGYSEIVAVRAYDDAAFKADPLKCKPVYVATTV